MYKIGEFSKITHLTVKTLHYYDAEEILKPSQYSENGYRLYNNADFEKAKKIILLRELDFSIREIKEVLANTETEEDLQYFFKEKKEMIEDKIKNQKELVKKLDTYLLPSVARKQPAITYQIAKKEFEEIEVATMRFVGSYPTVGVYFGKLYRYLKSNTTGAPFVCYYDETYKDEADIAVCVPIKKPILGTKEITIEKLPKISALVTTHIGSYEKLNLAYKALLDYAINNSIEIASPSRERYIKGPGMMLKGNPEKYITEIMIPIKE